MSPGIWYDMASSYESDSVDSDRDRVSILGLVVFPLVIYDSLRQGYGYGTMLGSLGSTGIFVASGQGWARLGSWTVAVTGIFDVS